MSRLQRCASVAAGCLLVVAACAAPAPSASGPPVPTPAAPSLTSSPASPDPEATPTSPGPSAPPFSLVPPGSCPIVEQSGALPSERLVDAELSTSGVAERLTFTFDLPPDLPLGPTGRLRAVLPPFFEAGRGNEVVVTGDRFVEIRFDGLLLVDESGTVLFNGLRDARPSLPAVEQIALTDAFEGVMTWIVGLRGGGCVMLGGDPGEGIVTVDFVHP